MVANCRKKICTQRNNFYVALSAVKDTYRGANTTKKVGTHLAQRTRGRSAGVTWCNPGRAGKTMRICHLLIGVYGAKTYVFATTFIKLLLYSDLPFRGARSPAVCRAWTVFGWQLRSESLAVTRWQTDSTSCFGGPTRGRWGSSAAVAVRVATSWQEGKIIFVKHSLLV